eukprot:1248457-Pyramimonas_sp.AAC.1
MCETSRNNPAGLAVDPKEPLGYWIELIIGLLKGAPNAPEEDSGEDRQEEGYISTAALGSQLCGSGYATYYCEWWFLVQVSAVPARLRPHL